MRNNLLYTISSHEINLKNKPIKKFNDSFRVN